MNQSHFLNIAQAYNDRPIKEGIVAQNTDGTDIEAFGMYYKDLIDPITKLVG